MKPMVLIYAVKDAFKTLLVFENVSQLSTFFVSCDDTPHVFSWVVMRLLPPFAKGLLYSHSVQGTALAR